MVMLLVEVQAAVSEVGIWVVVLAKVPMGVQVVLVLVEGQAVVSEVSI